MERLNRGVGLIQAALHEAPVVFRAVRVDGAVIVGRGMVDDPAGVPPPGRFSARARRS